MNFLLLKEKQKEKLGCGIYKQALTWLYRPWVTFKNIEI